MQTLEKLMQGLALVGQLGVCVITPPLLLGYLAYQLAAKHSWGWWVIVLALLVGLLSGLCSAWSMLRPKKEQDTPKTTIHFNDHS